MDFNNTTNLTTTTSTVIVHHYHHYQNLDGKIIGYKSLVLVILTYIVGMLAGSLSLQEKITETERDVNQ